MNIDTREFRDALGRFATGVCVITASSDEVAPFGMTVNSFASLSLEPPMVLWSLGKSSDCFERFASLDHYVVNILRESQQDLSNRFAAKGDHALNDGEWQKGENSLPVLIDPLAVFECDIVNRVDGGDHTILIGRVTRADFSEGKPLLFFGGNYGAIK
jgi:flavin reductase (DIM6/NTAB) family NADH-FMN oxidoreductase RutF